MLIALWQFEKEELLASLLLFTLFGLGCAACIASGRLALALMSLTGALGIVAGLASRWAAVPRAAITTMVLTATPPTLALANAGRLGKYGA